MKHISRYYCFALSSCEVSPRFSPKGCRCSPRRSRAPSRSPNRYWSPPRRCLNSSPVRSARRSFGYDDRHYKSPSRRKHRKQVPTPKFNGKGEWLDFFHTFKMCAKWNEWSYTEMGLQLAISLVGEASEVLAGMGRKREDFASLVSAIELRYSPGGTEVQYRRKLLSYRCAPTQDLKAYGHELKRLARRAYPCGSMDEKVLTDIFIQGLPNNAVCRHVFLVRCFTSERC